MTPNDHRDLQNLIDEEVIHESVQAKLTRLESIRKSMLRERVWNRVLTILSIVVGSVGVILGAWGLIVLTNYLDTVEKNKITTCQFQRDVAINFDKGIEEDAETVFLIGSPSPQRSQELNDAVMQGAIARVDDLRENYTKIRSCTPDAIAEWYRTGGKRGYEDKPVIVQAQPLTTPAIPQPGGK